MRSNHKFECVLDSLYERIRLCLYLYETSLRFAEIAE